MEYKVIQIKECQGVILQDGGQQHVRKVNRKLHDTKNEYDAEPFVYFLFLIFLWYAIRNLPKVVSWVTIVYVRVQIIGRLQLSGNRNRNQNLNPGNHRSGTLTKGKIIGQIDQVEFSMCQKIKGRQGTLIR